ncbi:MAG: tyrosine-type recombinase/integrase [Bryobacteraceae bacterium]
MLVQSAALDLSKLGRHMPRERHQNGWVEKTGKKAKTWTGYWYEYVVSEGTEKRMQRSKVLGRSSEMTKGAAEAALREEIQGGRPPQIGATFGQLAAWYLKTNEGLWSKKWNDTSKGLFKYQILPRLGDRIAADLRRSDIQQAINDIAADPKSRSESCVKKCLTHIRAVFNFTIDDELLERNPALKVEMPPTRRASERFLTLEECKSLLAAAGRRDNLIVRLFMVVGLRPSELFALRINDLQIGELRIDETVVLGEVKDQTKTEGSRGNVPLPPDLEAELRAYLRAEKITDFLFPSEAATAISPDNYLDRVLKRLGVLANIDVFTQKEGGLSSKLNHQVLRRTTATHFQKHGKLKSTQDLLRHARPETTLRHYQKTLDEDLVRGVESWDAELVQKKGPRSASEITGFEGTSTRSVN